MLGFLKRLFGIKDDISEPKNASVKLNELEQWFTITRQPLTEKLSQQITATKEKVRQYSEQIRQKITGLQSATLMNPNIPERAKDIMQGNREEYCRRVNHYVDMLILPDTPDELQDFFSQHDKDAGNFTQAVLKPFSILQEFFANETREITAILGSIEKELLDLRNKLSGTRINADTEVLTRIQILVAKQKLLQGLETEQKELETQITDSERTLQALAQEKTRLEQHPERQNAMQKIAEADERKRVHEQKIKIVFSQFEPALRKFHKMATRHVKLVNQYLREPVTALVEDIKLDIIEVISDIRRLFVYKRLDLGDKHSYAVAAMQKLNKEELGNWLREYAQLSKQIRNSESALKQLEQTKTLERVKRLHEETSRSTLLTKQKLGDVQKNRNNIKLEELKKELEQKLQETTGINVSIKIS
jgi:hypothetical protein